MKALEKDLQSIVKVLKSLTRQTEKMAKKLDKLDKTKPAKKPGRKTRAKVRRKTVAKKAARATAIDKIFAIISKSKKGVNTATLNKTTGFDNKKIHNVINRLKQQGKVKSAAVGIYVKK